MPVTTRSGNKYNNNNSIEKKTHVSHCSYCNSREHKISECNCEEIEKLHQKTIYATIFSTYILESHAFLRLWLNTLTEPDIYIIGKNLGIGSFFKAKKSKKVNDEINFIKKIIEEYYHTERFVPYESTTNLLYTIPDKTFILFKEILQNNMPVESYNNILEIISTTMPQKKFNIRIEQQPQQQNQQKTEEGDCPICFGTTNKEDNVKTNCQHSFCSECISQMFKASNQNNRRDIGCPYCRTTITSLQTNDEFTTNLFKTKYCYNIQQIQQPIHQLVHQLVEQPIHQLVEQLVEQPIHQPSGLVNTLILHLLTFQTPIFSA